MEPARGLILHFCFPKPGKLIMDVKFPLDNYLKCIEAETPEEERRLCQLFRPGCSSTL